MTGRASGIAALAALLLALLPAAAAGHGDGGPAEPLTRIGPAPEVRLTAQDGRAFALSALRGKVVALNFIYTNCADTCPLMTYKMVGIQQRLGDAFGREVYFVTVTVDPGHDTPAVLADYAAALGCDPDGWAFLTGSPEAIHAIARGYGVVDRAGADGEITHNLLTSLIDREGMLRVQYMGERFDPEDLLHDLRDLMREAPGR